MTAPQKSLTDLFPLEVPPEPMNRTWKRRLTPAPYDVRELAHAWADCIREMGAATVEDAYDRLQAEPASDSVGPDAAAVLRTWGFRPTGLSRVAGRGPRKGARIAVWGVGP